MARWGRDVLPVSALAYTGLTRGLATDDVALHRHVMAAVIVGQKDPERLKAIALDALDA